MESPRWDRGVWPAGEETSSVHGELLAAVGFGVERRRPGPVELCHAKVKSGGHFVKYVAVYPCAVHLRGQRRGRHPEGMVSHEATERANFREGGREGQRWRRMRTERVHWMW